MTYKEDMKMKAKQRAGHVGSVVGASGHAFDVRVTPRQKVVVITGTGCEWRWPLSEYKPLNSEHSVLFQRVEALLKREGVLS